MLPYGYILNNFMICWQSIKEYHQCIKEYHQFGRRWIKVGEIKRKSGDGFTDKQREWIRGRDGNKCVICESDDHMEVHHLTPFRYAMNVLHWTFERTNLPTNGITLCRHCHRGDENSVHPDTARASRMYHSNKNSYSDMFSLRDELCRKKVEYWNSSRDNEFAVIAATNTISYVSEGHYPTPWNKEEVVPLSWVAKNIQS